MVNKPFLWVLFIVIGAIVSGLLLSLADGHKAHVGEKTLEDKREVSNERKVNDESLDSILTVDNIKVNVDVESRDELLRYLSNLSVSNGYSSDANAVYN
ncbi:PTS fructose transporter subunit IIABC, partial [Enterococcus faecium]|nr:PTS fructose transporter subunit IIABC [Enterococcus faecium]